MGTETNETTSTNDSSPSIAALAAALAKAQAKMTGATKSATNPHFRNTYADLAAVWEAWRAAGPENGLSVLQLPVASSDRNVTIRTVLAHASGEWIASTLTMPVSKADAQAVGSALTYARRYALAAMVGIAPEDDDGNAATGADRRAQNEPPPRQNGNAPANREPPPPRERSAEWADAIRMCKSARNDAELERARDFIVAKLPKGHADRDAAIDAWEEAAAALAPAKRAS